MSPSYLRSQLTKREWSVLDVICLGYTSKQISQKLNISVSTVEFHRANICNKLEAESLADLISWHSAHAASNDYELYYDIINRATDLIWRATLSGEFTFFSKSLEQVTGFEPKELLNKSFYEWAPKFIAEESIPWTVQSLEDRASGRLGHEPITFDVILLKKDGTKYPVEINSGPILSDSGKILGIQGINRIKVGAE